jgi:hypothetical protein
MNDLEKKLALLKQQPKPAEKDSAPVAVEVADDAEWIEEETVFGIARRLKNPPPPPPVIQDEGDPEFTPFKVGQLSSRHYWGCYTPHDHNDHPNCTDARQALPAAKWPSPGEVASPEVEAAHNKECAIVSEADRTLHSLLTFLRFNPDEKNPSWHQENVERPAQEYKFLQGLWTARGVAVPTRDELVKMALQLQPASAEEVPAKARHYLKYFEGKPIPTPNHFRRQR